MKAEQFFKFLKITKFALDMFLFLKDIDTGNVIGIASTIYNLIMNHKAIANE